MKAAFPEAEKEAVLDQFRCVECKQVGLLPWNICYDGSHMLCDPCYLKRWCPICEAECWSRDRPLHLEAIAKALKVSLHCTYPGCAVTFSASDEKGMAQHQLGCPFRIFHCFADDHCRWRGRRDDFFIHAHSAHSTMPCNKSSIEWIDLPAIIKLDKALLAKDEESTYARLYYFLRVPKRELKGLLVLDFWGEKSELLDDYPCMMHSVLAETVWLPPTGIASPNDVLTKVTLSHDDRWLDVTSFTTSGDVGIIGNLDVLDPSGWPSNRRTFFVLRQEEGFPLKVKLSLKWEAFLAKKRKRALSEEKTRLTVAHEDTKRARKDEGEKK